ncbi:MAG TPA: ATP-binding cassette domain-containing protein [Burkholderiales bacterium]|nr:ATP-binding cassette domain-containing protein [Burkholderiales bacterium]
MRRDIVDAVPAVQAEGLTKRYGSTLAVDGLNLEIPAGQFFGLLGPNGSGKTSTIHMLSTLIRPSQGRAQIVGHDVRRAGLQVRAAIGVVFQESALDRTLSAAENLRFAGLLHNLPVAQIRERSGELLELFGLKEKRNQAVGTLSGGQRRALDIARGVIHRPQILFLDEPTIGLDVPNRRKIWRFIERLRAEFNVTVFLTTHYLEEAADCDKVAFIKQGRIVKIGPPHDLIDGLGAYIIEIESENLRALVESLTPRLGPSLIDGDKACFRFTGKDISPLVMLQIELGNKVISMRWRRPNLNDVFLWINETELWQVRKT